MSFKLNLNKKEKIVKISRDKIEFLLTFLEIVY